jgi:steroid 5-alpha reductase family enzyme
VDGSLVKLIFQLSVTLFLCNFQEKTVGHTTWSTGKGKKIMTGGLFDYVECAHFFYEIVSWVGFALCTNLAGGPVLVAIWSIGGLIMMALARRKNYVKYFNGKEGRPLYPENRKAIIPFVI